VTRKYLQNDYYFHRNELFLNPYSKLIGQSGTQLGALAMKQTAIYDGPEFISIASVLRKMLQDDDEDEEGDCVPSKRAGYLTFITGTLKDATDPTTATTTTTKRILGIEIDADYSSDEDSLVQVDENVYIQKDSMVTIPKGISDHDAISTACAALAGVYCSIMPIDAAMNVSYMETQKKAVVLGGGDYACFIAKALDCLGVKVTIVTTRPMSLKETPLNPLYRSNGEYTIKIQANMMLFLLLARLFYI
jgi:hypothetical protein